MNILRLTKRIIDIIKLEETEKHLCLRCGSLLSYDSASGMLLPPWKDGFGHMCHADSRLHCTVATWPDELEKRLKAAEGLANEWKQKYYALLEKHITLLHRGENI